MATQTLVSEAGKPFIQAEELTDLISKAIEGASAEYAVGFAAILGSIEQLKAQYAARVALIVQRQNPQEMIAVQESIGRFHAARAAIDAAVKEQVEAASAAPAKKAAAKVTPIARKTPAARTKARK
ncbi:hypothetical protein AWB80_07519 [Caballeronia pedi]|uniref:Uncharacterized protein n=1 Tax=Caballeronia pedi TaxID=1777141 RepID=A0A158DV47_9BURK|nr:hypothetical protein [Caballeronia pedi]SAK98434.1 hypothetical protein AWB80_07519 [Caballeronia pedi]